MPLIERYSTLSCCLHGIDEERLGRGQNVLVGSELQFVCALLDVMAVDVGSLLLPMQHQPEFEAGIGDRDLDPTLPSIVDGLCEVGVLIDVEHAPDLVEIRIRALRPTVAPHVLLRTTDERFRSHSTVADVKAHVTAVAACPQGQITRFGDLALRKYADYTSRLTWPAMSTLELGCGPCHESVKPAAR